MNFITHIKKKKSLSIISEERSPLKIKQLNDVLLKNSKSLKYLDITKKNTVAIVLDNGLDFVVSFLSVINNCISAPLNPNYSIGEFEFYYGDLKPKLIITNFDEKHPSVVVAKKNNIKIIKISNCLLEVSSIKKINKDKIKKNIPTTKDIAIILHTSGTTSKPKMVPLNHENLLSSSDNISKTLKLKTKDKNIILMPSFHIHGIVASILAPLYAGSQIVVLPKFNVLTFYSYLDKYNPTWFTAVPTMLQSIKDRSKNNLNIIKNCKLRFIRSSSASLPVPILKDIEKIFGVPVIESYGMTEAAHQMTSNLLPPKKREVGSVGFPVGIKVRIFKDKNDLQIGEVGEVIIKGKSVFKGYIAKPHTNASSFINGWFRTGDLGYFNKEGSLFITGRIKEIINRGGEKISPKEVDDVFMKNIKIEKAVAFSIKHEKLGEDICLAVVLKKGKKCSSSELKEFARNKLANFKIPKKIYFLDEIPTGATGKMQRIGLAKKLELE